MGTDNHQDKMVVVQNRYQLRLNYNLMKQHAYVTCVNNITRPWCVEYQLTIHQLAESEILNIMFESLAFELDRDIITAEEYMAQVEETYNNVMSDDLYVKYESMHTYFRDGPGGIVNEISKKAELAQEWYIEQLMV